MSFEKTAYRQFAVFEVGRTAEPHRAPQLCLMAMVRVTNPLLRQWRDMSEHRAASTLTTGLESRRTP
jgi:hypothetical protein